MLKRFRKMFGPAEKKPATVVRERLVEFIFSPLVEFEWAEDGRVIGLYVPGNTYNCSRQPVHDRLRAKCAEWQEEGKIEVAPLIGGRQFVVTEFK